MTHDELIGLGRPAMTHDELVEKVAKARGEKT